MQAWTGCGIQGGGSHLNVDHCFSFDPHEMQPLQHADVS